MEATERTRETTTVKVVVDTAPAAAETPPPPSPNKILQQQRYVAGGRRKRSDVKPGAVAIAGRAVPARASQRRETLHEVFRCNPISARTRAYPTLAFRLVCKDALGCLTCSYNARSLHAQACTLDDSGRAFRSIDIPAVRPREHEDSGAGLRVQRAKTAPASGLAGESGALPKSQSENARCIATRVLQVEEKVWSGGTLGGIRVEFWQVLNPD